jgi:hypothetical protein
MREQRAILNSGRSFIKFMSATRHVENFILHIVDLT